MNVMKIEGEAKLLTIYIGEHDHYRHRPLYQVIVETLREKGVAGATVLRGIEGYGKRSRIHTASILRLSEDLPIVIQVIDNEERIRSILPAIDEMVPGGLVTLQAIDVMIYRPEMEA
jgi:PII-like signaling protein